MKLIDVVGNEIEFECLGCDIASHRVIPPGGYVYEDDLINVSVDPEIPIPGFMVLGISKHIKSMNELSKEERYHIIDILNNTISAIKKSGISDEVLIIQEENSRHFHIWIVPIYEWMNKFDKDVRNIDKIIEYSKNRNIENTKVDILNAVKKIKEAYSND